MGCVEGECWNVNCCESELFRGKFCNVNRIESGLGRRGLVCKLNLMWVV